MRLGPAGLGESVAVVFMKECAGVGKAKGEGSRSRQAAIDECPISRVKIFVL